MSAITARPPHTIRMHPRDNVAIVANDGGLAVGTVLPSGLVLKDKVPQGHKVALVDLPANGPVLPGDVPDSNARPSAEKVMPITS